MAEGFPDRKLDSEASIDGGLRCGRKLIPIAVFQIETMNDSLIDEFLASRGKDMRVDALVARAGVADLLFERARIGDAMLAEDVEDAASGNDVAFLASQFGHGGATPSQRPGWIKL